MVWHPDMDVRCGVRTARLPGVQGTVLYEGSDVRTVNGFVLPRDRGLECARIAKILPKKLGDYNCLITGI